MKNYSPLAFYFRILAVSLFIIFLGLAPVPHAVNKLFTDAHLAIHGNEWLAAARNLAGITEYYPWRSELNITAAQYAFQAGDSKATIQYLERPGTVSKLTSSDLILLGDAYKQSGNSAMAEAIWKRVTELGDSIAAIQRLADLYLSQKDYTSAAAILQKQLILESSNAELNQQIGELYVVTDPDKALTFFAKAKEIDPIHATQAKTLYDKIRTANLFDEPAYTALIVGRQLGEWGKWELAEAAFKQAIALRPEYPDAWAFLGEAKQQADLQETGFTSNLGLPELEQAIQMDGSSVLVNTLLALYWERQENYSQAEQFIRQAIQTDPKDPYLYSELGNILSKAGDLPSAQLAFEQAINLNPQNPLFYCQLAQFALDNNIQIRELALPALRQAILLDPQNATSLDLLAQVMLILVDYNSAERFALSAIQSDPQYAQAYLHLGTAYLYQGKSGMARLWLERAETVDPTSWVAAQASRMVEYYFP